MARSAILLLAGTVLAGCGVPAGGSLTAAVAAGPAPVGSMSELMVRLIYPTSDAVFYIQTRTPTSQTEWEMLETQTLTLAESANLLMAPERRWDDGRWIADAELMRAAAAAAFEAAKARDVDALIALNDPLYQSCVTCHQDYRPDYGR